MPLLPFPHGHQPAIAQQALERQILQGYRARHASANHRPGTAHADLAVWARFTTFTGRPFWRWVRADMDVYGAARRTQVAASTLRREQGAIFRLLQFARDPAYPFDDACYALTGRRIPQICVPENTIHHRQSAPTSKRRNYTPAELDRLFTTIRTHIARVRGYGPRRALAASAHYAALCFALAFGTRAFETVMADLEDLSPATTPAIAAFSPFEDVVVRFGKAFNGGDYKRRAVPAIAVFRTYLAAIGWYLRTIRPLQVRPHSPPALFLSQTGGRLRAATLSGVLMRYRRRAQLSPDLTLHCLRHTFETTLHESGLDLTTIKDLMGHEHEATTAIYDHLSSERIRDRCLRLNQRLIAESERRRMSCGA